MVTNSTIYNNNVDSHEILLDIENLNVSYIVKEKRIKAVRNANIKLYTEKSLGIVGESGSGKSTLALAILSLLSKNNTEISGNIFFKEKNLLNMNSEEMRDIRWQNISIVFQNSMNSLSPIHKIGKQITDIYRVHKPKASKSKIKEETLKLFSMCNLPDRVFQSYPYELSGGMMQRVGIVLSLLHYPDVIILDEATTALDVVIQAQIMSQIKKLRRELKVTPIFITHDLSVVHANCEYIAVMYAGYIIEYGDTADITAHPSHPYTSQLISAYPEFGMERGSIKGIPGTLPDLSRERKGCIFAPRCSYANKICFEEEPILKNTEGTRLVACHMVGRDGFGK